MNTLRPKPQTTFEKTMVIDQWFSNFFVATPLETFAGLATHQQYELNKNAFYQSFIY